MRARTYTLAYYARTSETIKRPKTLEPEQIWFTLVKRCWFEWSKSFYLRYEKIGSAVYTMDAV